MRLRLGSGPGSMPFSDGVVWIVVDLVDGAFFSLFFPLGMVQIKQLFLILGGGALCLTDDG